ncbi:MAG TPA: multicopper oxidase domain-containing protein, partial [Gammaproteobacteria bacterium]
AKISYLVTADARGPWAYHCHLLYHMAGMMRTVIVGDEEPDYEHHHD